MPKRNQTPPEEQQELDCTVKDKMDYMAGHIVRYFDAILQKEKTNQSAVADLIVDGVVIAEKLPATFLLGLEKRLKLVREVYKQIPTLPLGKKWLEDSTMGQGVYLCHTPDEKFKTRKVFRFNVLYEATPEHPAQIEKWEEQENVGKYVTVTWSGMITSAKKSSILGRVDKLIRATKKARQRANAAEVVELSVGKEIFDYIGLGSV